MHLLFILLILGPIKPSAQEPKQSYISKHNKLKFEYKVESSGCSEKTVDYYVQKSSDQLEVDLNDPSEEKKSKMTYENFATSEKCSVRVTYFINERPRMPASVQPEPSY